MFAYEVWATILVLGMAFAVLYPEDTANLLKLLALVPSIVRLWVIQRLYMLKLGPRLMLDRFLMERRVKQLRRRYNSTEPTNTETKE